MNLRLGVLIGAWTNTPSRPGAPVSNEHGPRFRPSATALRRSVFVLLALALSSCGTPEEEGPFVVEPNAAVTRVVDGDTIEVTIEGTKEKVRLIGVDTPETVHPNQPVGCYGEEASSFTKSTLPEGTRVRIEVDAEERDVYGRLLAYVYRAKDGFFVNGELAAQGYAQVLTIPPNVAHTDEFVGLAADARAADRGLWAACPADSGS